MAVAIMLSIGWKITIQPDNESYLTNQLVNFLKQNHFNVVVTNEIVDYTPIVEAATDSCRLQVARLTADGSNRDLIRNLASAADRSFVVFRGTVYAQQPVPLTVLHYLWSRSLRELGLVRHITPVMAVAASPSCNAEQLPWAKLQDL